MLFCFHFGFYHTNSLETISPKIGNNSEPENIDILILLSITIFTILLLAYKLWKTGMLTYTRLRRGGECLVNSVILLVRQECLRIPAFGGGGECLVNSVILLVHRNAYIAPNSASTGNRPHIAYIVIVWYNWGRSPIGGVALIDFALRSPNWFRVAFRNP